MAVRSIPFTPFKFLLRISHFHKTKTQTWTVTAKERQVWPQDSKLTAQAWWKKLNLPQGYFVQSLGEKQPPGTVLQTVSLDYMLLQHKMCSTVCHKAKTHLKINNLRILFYNCQMINELTFVIVFLSSFFFFFFKLQKHHVKWKSSI